MFFTRAKFEKAVEKEVQRRMDDYLHTRWLEDRLEKLQDRVTYLEIKSYNAPEVPVECNCCEPK